MFDGTVVTHAGENDEKVATLTTIDYKQFLDTYEKDNRDPFEAAKYPAESALNNKKWTIIEFKSKVGVALGTLGRNVGDVNVICRLKPGRGVIALDNFEAGDLVLVPMSGTIKAEPNDSEDAKSNMACGGAAPLGHTMVVAPQSDIPCPFWFVQPTDDVKKANVTISRRPVVVQTKFTGKPKVADSSTIDIPVFVNSKVVQKGCELFFFKEAKSKSGTKRAFVMLGGASSSAKSQKK